MTKSTYDPSSSAPMSAIVRVAIVVVTLALFFEALLNAILGQRDIAVVLALATPLGISAWGFARAGHNEAAMGLVCCVLIVVVTLILVLNPLGVHGMVVTAYAGIVLMAALLLSRRAFLAIVGLTLFAATSAFFYDLNGHSRSLVSRYSGWPQYLDFLVITAMFAILGRITAERLFGSIGSAHAASQGDALTGLASRAGFLPLAKARLEAARAAGHEGVLVVADLDEFRRLNQVVGHEAADNVLREVARRLLAANADSLVARLGDDEFAVLAIGVPEAEAAAFARAVHQALDFDYLGVSVRNAAGYARFPRDAHSFESLLLAAENWAAGAKVQEEERLSGPVDRI